MGIVKSEDRRKSELEDFRHMLVAAAGVHRRKDQQDRFTAAAVDLDFDQSDRLVCVTSGFSFLGIAIVNKLLARGYSVRIIVDNPEDLEKIREMERSNSNISAIMAKLTDEESLSEAFKDCRGAFHTSAFIDPAGLSGYTKYMVDVEVKGSENVIKACGRTPSVNKCVMTSSLLACIWPDSTTTRHGIGSSPTIINHDSWSDESLCRDKKLWYALGKLRAEKAAWTVAEENGLKLATICPALITGPEFRSRNSTATIAYLKGAQEMYESGVLATVDVNRLAEAHVSVFEAMNKKTSWGGRYICFDKVIQGEEEAEKLARDISMPPTKIYGAGSSNVQPQTPFQLSNRKLLNLMSAEVRPCYNATRNRSF